MKFYPNFKVVAVAERSAGNDTVGDEWIETKIFEPFDPIFKIIKWAESVRCSGKLILTLSEVEQPQAVTEHPGG